jgi:membrane-bound lytic murein transglycosylase D
MKHISANSFFGSKVHRLFFLVISICFFSVSTNVCARQDEDSALTNDVNQIKYNFEDNLDSMLNLWYVQNSPAVIDMVNDSISKDSIYSSIPDSVYINRLSKIPSVFKLTYNSVVRKYIEMYTQKKRNIVQPMLGAAEYYFPIFDDIFDYYDVPNELKYMSIIESALNPRARSRTRAIGVWQFMYGTGKRYGLTINSLVDERRDPIKATHAAARFSRDLYQIFGDWQLVVAAYNCGPANVNKAIRRAGGKKDFWDIYRYLPRETRGHVPAFIAAVYTFTYYKEHGLTPIPVMFPKYCDTIMLHNDLHLMQVADVLKIPISQLRDMNPQYIHDVIPAKGITSYPLALPMEYSSKFIDLQDSVFSYKDSFFFNMKELLKSPNYNKFTVAGVKPSGNYSAVYYTVKNGDNLGFISEWFDCRVNDIMDWNDLYGSRIRAGQKLVIYVPRKAKVYYQQFDDLSFDEKQRIKGTGQIVNTPPASNAIVHSSDQSGNFVYYIVKEGDTLWDIAKLYPGITGDDICKWNNLSQNAMIVPGQKIKIKVI